MTKLAAFVLSPLGVVFGLLAIAVWCVVTDRRRWAVGVLLAAGGWLYAWSCPVVANWVTRWWEARYLEPALADVPAAEVVVTLGGVMRGAGTPGRYPDLDSGADRLWQAARLYRAGKARRILVSGGGRGSESEAAASVPFLIDLGVPREVILLEERSVNTFENARESAVLLGTLSSSSSSSEEREGGGARERGGVVLLVTSATHLPRAMMAFRHVGLDPFPVPTDFQGVAPGSGWRRWLPSPDALAQSSVTVKEVVGSVWYGLRYRGVGDG